MDSSSMNLARAIADAAWDKKARGLKVVEIADLLPIADYFVLCSGRSDRQVVAIADNIEKTLRNAKKKPRSVEGKQSGRWVCMDYGDVVVHIFQDEWRHHYDLEGLWRDAPELVLERPTWEQAESEFAFFDDDAELDAELDADYVDEPDTLPEYAAPGEIRDDQGDDDDLSFDADADPDRETWSGAGDGLADDPEDDPEDDAEDDAEDDPEDDAEDDARGELDGDTEDLDEPTDPELV